MGVVVEREKAPLFIVDGFVEVGYALEYQRLGID